MIKKLTKKFIYLLVDNLFCEKSNLFIVMEVMVMAVLNTKEVETLQIEETPEPEGETKNLAVKTETMEDSIRRVEQEVDQIREDITAFKSALSQEVGDLRVRLDELSVKTNIKLEKATNRFSTEIGNLQKSLDDIAERVERNRELANVLEAELDENIKRMESRIAELQKDLTSTVKALEDRLRENMDALDRRLKELKKAFSERVDAVREEASRMVEELEKNVSSAVERIDRNEATVDDLKSRISKVFDDLADVRALSKELSSTIREVQNQLTKVSVESEKNRHMAGSLRIELKEARDKFFSELKEMSSKLGIALATIEKDRGEINDVRTDLEKVRKEINEALTNIRENRSKSVALEREFKEKYEELSARITDIRGNLTSTLKGLEAELKEEVTALHGKISGVQEGLSSLRDSLEGRLDSLTKEINELKAEIGKVESAAEDLRERENKRHEWTVDAINAIVNKPFLRRPKIPEPAD